MKSGGKPGSMSASLGRSSPRPPPRCRWSQADGLLLSARRRSQSPLSGAAAIIISGKFLLENILRLSSNRALPGNVSCGF